MKKGLIALAVIIGVLLLLISPLVGTYNSLVTAQEKVNGTWKQVENQLQRRYDLIPNLVETVKGYAAFEKDVLTEVTNARARVGQAGTPGELIKANADLSGALSRLLVVVENYPQLKANENFLKLQDELAGTENRIAISRKDYNEVVQSFNANIKRFPTNLIAGTFGFEPFEYFEMDQEAAKAPKVNFSK